MKSLSNLLEIVIITDCQWLPCWKCTVNLSFQIAVSQPYSIKWHIKILSIPYDEVLLYVCTYPYIAVIGRIFLWTTGRISEGRGKVFGGQEVHWRWWNICFPPQHKSRWCINMSIIIFWIVACTYISELESICIFYSFILFIHIVFICDIRTYIHFLLSLLR